MLEASSGSTSPDFISVSDIFFYHFSIHLDPFPYDWRRFVDFYHHTLLWVSGGQRTGKSSLLYLVLYNSGELSDSINLLVLFPLLEELLPFTLPSDRGGSDNGI